MRLAPRCPTARARASRRARRARPRPSCSPRRRRAPRVSLPRRWNSANECVRSAVPSPVRRCSRRTPSTETHPQSGLPCACGRQIAMPAGTPLDLRDEPQRRVALTHAAQPVQPLLVRRRRVPPVVGERLLADPVEKRLVDALDRRPDAGAAPASRVRRPARAGRCPSGTTRGSGDSRAPREARRARSRSRRPSREPRRPARAGRGRDARAPRGSRASPPPRTSSQRTLPSFAWSPRSP